jgi:hypothetical protein
MSLGTDLPAGLALLDSYASPQQERSQRGGKRFKLVVLNEGVATARQMLLWMSSGEVKIFCGDELVELAGDVTLEAADDFFL